MASADGNGAVRKESQLIDFHFGSPFLYPKVTAMKVALNMA